MAIGTPVERATQATSTNATTRVVTIASDTTVGTTLFVLCRIPSTATLSSVSDTRGNTWTVDHNYTANSTSDAVASCVVAAGKQILTGDTVTLTLSAGVNGTVAIWIEEVSGLATSAFDTSADATITSSSTLTVGPTATLSQANEIAWAIIAKSATTSFTKDAAWSAPTTATLNSTTAALEYQIVSSTSALSTTVTGGSLQTWIGTIVTYKGAAAPTNSVAPVVSGTTTVGQALSTTNGTWTGSPTFTYQWQRDNTGGGSYSNIGSATSSSYTLVNADDGCNIRCVVTGTNAGGNASANSNSVGTVIEPVPANSVAPSVSGSTPIGSSLSTTDGTWNNMAGLNPTFTYQWTRDGSNISSATSSTYTSVTADGGHAVGCTVTAHNTGGTASQASSNTISVAAASTPSTGGDPSKTAAAVTLLGL